MMLPRGSLGLGVVSLWAACAACGAPDDELGLEDEPVGEVADAISGTFRLKAVHSGRCLDVAGASSADGAAIIQYDCHDGANQEWRLEDRGGGQYTIASVASGKCLEVQGGSTANGGSVQQQGCANVDQQRWTLELQASGQYRVRAVHSGRCLDVTGKRMDNGASLEQWSCSSGANQRFALEPLVSAVASPIGSGWVPYSPTKKIHLDDNHGLQTFNWTSSKSVCSPSCADYHYDSATDTETFRVIDNRSNRSEIRLANDYTTGSRQFQGYVTFSAPLNDESLFQVWGSTSGATQLMLRGYAGSGGSIRGGGKTLATGIYGVEQRVNVIHRQGRDIRIYINGSLKHTIVDDEVVPNYHKYGCYGTLHTGAATVKWRAARFYRDGQP